jgi:CHAD domain-containing protein
VIRHGRNVRHLADPELHGVRTSLEKLRYSVDYLAGLYPLDAIQSYLKQCKSPQALLGKINDSRTAVTLSEKLSQGGGRLDLAPAAGALA